VFVYWLPSFIDEDGHLPTAAHQQNSKVSPGEYNLKSRPAVESSLNHSDPLRIDAGSSEAWLSLQRRKQAEYIEDSMLCVFGFS
jgi:hypothetical protein